MTDLELMQQALGEARAAGAAGSVLSVLNHAALNHQMVLERGLLAEESTALLREFFQRRRSSPKAEPTTIPNPSSNG
jgi:tRNA(adenine34) deaminase